MIASIRGSVAATDRDFIVLEVGGIGYKVFVPQRERLSGDDVFLHTYLVVREDELSLYGFASTLERNVFEVLIRVNGVGPKLAMAILSTLNVDNLRNAVVSERAEVLQRVPGVGKKTAQKIVLELKDKLRTVDSIPIDAETVGDDVNADVLDTLVALGYSVVEAQTAIQALPSDAPDDVNERVRLALQYFA